MEEEILRGYEQEVLGAGQELSGFLQKHLFNLLECRQQLRFHYDLLMLKLDEYEKALDRYSRNKATEKFNIGLRRVK